MMPEISLNVLDVAENSIRAEASLVQILVTVDLEGNRLEIQIKDDGKGMTEEQMAKVRYRNKQWQ